MQKHPFDGNKEAEFWHSAAGKGNVPRQGVEILDRVVSSSGVKRQGFPSAVLWTLRFSIM